MSSATLNPEQVLEDEQATGPVSDLSEQSATPDENTPSATVAPPSPDESTTGVDETEDALTSGQASEESEHSGPPPEPEPHPDRAAALRPFFVKLHELLDAHRDLDSPSQINIGEYSLHATIWERNIALSVLDGDAGGEPGWVRRVAEAIAFQAKCMVDLNRLNQLDSGENELRERVESDLYLGAAIGRALYTEIQKVVDSMVVSGEMDPARRMTQLRNKVKVSLNWLKEVLSEDAMARSERFAEEMVCIPSDAVLPDPKKRRRRRRADLNEPQVIIRSEAIREDRSRIRKMAAALVILTIAWIYFVLMPMTTRKTIPELTVHDFNTVAEIEAVQARPPSLYVTVSSHHWNRLGDSGKQWVVDATGRIALSHGYSGAVFKTSDGEAVAQWMQKTGTRVYAAP